MKKFLEFNNFMDWLHYTSQYMRDAEQRKEMFCVTIRDRNSDVIAKWSFDGSGQVWEKRSDERLTKQRSENDAEFGA